MIRIVQGRSRTIKRCIIESTLDAPRATLARTAGKIHPRLEAKIVDNDGHIAPRGTPGEILTRGYSVMLGYWEEEAQTKQAIDPARWMHTGDLGILDDEGDLQIVGRVKDMIIRAERTSIPPRSRTFSTNTVAGGSPGTRVSKYIRFVDAFPMTATGKAQKFLMRRMMMEREQASPGATYQAEPA